MTTPNFGWPLIQPTDLVTDLPADFETFADAVDADLDGLNGGTTGQVLTKVSGTDYDFAFGDAPGGSLVWTLLNTGGTALTGSTTITISGISDKENLFVLVDDASAGATALMGIRINADAGNNYDWSQIQLTGSAAYNTNVIGKGDTFATTRFFLGALSSNAASTLAGGFQLTGGKSTGIKTFTFSGSGNDSGGNSHNAFIGQGVYRGSAAVTSISIISTNGNFDNGTIYVYGA